MTFPFVRKLRLLFFRFRYRIKPEAVPAFLSIAADEFYKTVIGVGGYEEGHCARITVQKRLFKIFGEIGGFHAGVDSRERPINLPHLSAARAGIYPHRFPVENIPAVSVAGYPDALVQEKRGESGGNSDGSLDRLGLFRKGRWRHRPRPAEQPAS